MRTGRPIPPLTITGEERETLERWARRPTTGQAVAQRARLILSCAAGRTNTRVARDLHLTKQTVGKWRTRFLGKRLDGLLDEPRPGGPAYHQRCGCRAGADAHVGSEAGRRYALEYPVHGPGLRAEPEHGQSHLARLRAPAASRRDVQAVEGPAPFAVKSESLTGLPSTPFSAKSGAFCPTSRALAPAASATLTSAAATTVRSSGDVRIGPPLVRRCGAVSGHESG